MRRRLAAEEAAQHDARDAMTGRERGLRAGASALAAEVMADLAERASSNANANSNSDDGDGGLPRPTARRCGRSSCSGGTSDSASGRAPSGWSGTPCGSLTHRASCRCRPSAASPRQRPPPPPPPPPSALGALARDCNGDPRRLRRGRRRPHAAQAAA